MTGGIVYLVGVVACWPLFLKWIWAFVGLQFSRLDDTDRVLCGVVATVLSAMWPVGLVLFGAGWLARRLLAQP
jgi:hypothetical protein